jgi:hypothetical protein
LLTPITATPNLRAAFLRVEASRGMVGVDGVTLGAFRRQGERLRHAVLTEENYQPFIFSWK